MILVSAVEQNWGIGKDDKLPWSLPNELRWFREITDNKILIVGRRTKESIPHKFWKNRKCISVASQCDGTNYSLDFAKSVLSKDSSNCSLIGGAFMYSELMVYCNEAYITHIQNAYECDAFFPHEQFLTLFKFENIVKQHVESDGVNWYVSKYIKK